MCYFLYEGDGAPRRASFKEVGISCVELVFPVRLPGVGGDGRVVR